MDLTFCLHSCYDQNMKLFTSFLFVTTMAFSAEMTGWISDASCGAGNGNGSESARECAKRCIKDGAAPVFVTEKEGKVYRLANSDMAKTHLDSKVKITGDVKDGKLSIAKIIDIK